MADEAQNVVLDFKMNGQVAFANTVKDINTIMNTAAKEFRAQISAMDENASSSQRLAAEQQKLQIQSEAAAKRTQMLTAQLQAMQEKGQTSGTAFDRLVGKISDAQRVENNLKSALAGVNEQMTAHGQKANDARDRLSGLQNEEGELDQKMKLAASAAELENTKLGENASAAQKTGAAQRQLGSQLDLARQKVTNLERQLDATKSAYGENSSQATQMATRLNAAKTSVAGLENQMNGLSEKSRSSGGALGSLKEKLSFGAVAGVAANAVSTVTGGLGQLVSEGVEASDSMNKFNSTMQLAGFGKDAIKSAGAAVQDYANKTVYDLGTVSNTTAQLAANGVKDYTGLTEAAGNLNAQAGGNADTFRSVAMVMTQTAGAGKLTTENWNQLADAIPGASGKLQEAMRQNGAYTGNFRDAMEKGQISAGEFNKAISDLGMTKAAKDAAASTSTFEGAFGNLEANIVTGIQNIIQSLGKANLTNMINSISTVVVGAFKVIVSALQTIQEHSTAFKVLAVAVGVAVAAFKTMTMITTVINALKDFNAVTKITTALQAAFNAVMAINPFVLIITAIAAVVAALVYFFTQTKTGKEMWQNFITWLQGAWSGIVSFAKELWAGLSSFFTNLWNGIKAGVTAAWTAIKEVFTTVVTAISTFVKTAFTAAANVIKTIWNGIKTFFSVIWEGIKAVFTVAITAIAVIIGTQIEIWKTVITTAMNLIKTVITAVWNAIKAFFGPILSAIGNAIKSAWNGIKSVTTTVFNAVKTFIVNVWNAIEKFMRPLVLAIQSLVRGAWNGIKSITTSVFNAVKSFITSVWNAIKSAVSSAVNAIKSVVTSVWNAIKSAISSVMNAIKSVVSSAWNAIKSVTSSVFNSIRSVASSVWNSIKSVVSGAVNGVRSAVSSAWNAVRSVTSSVWNGIKSAISGPINAAKNAVGDAISAIKGFFNFSIHWPHIPMPHFGISPSGWHVGDLLKGSIPHLSVDWYAQGGIMTQPTMFGMDGARAQVGGEAGPEGVIPLNEDTWNKMGAAIAAHMPTGGPIVLQVDGRTFATITGPYTSDYLQQQDATQNFSYGRR